MSTLTLREAGRILVVDDDANLLRQAHAALSGAGSQGVVTTPSVQEAKRVIETSEIALAVVDLRMSGYEGVNFLQWVLWHSERRVSDLPVLVLVGHATQDERFFLADYDSVRILDKPFSDDELLTAVHSVLAGERGPDWGAHGLEDKYEAGAVRIIRSAIEKGDHDVALITLTERIKSSPESVRFQHLLALLLTERGMPTKAMEAINRALAQSPRDLQCLNLKSRLLVKAGAFEEALRIMEICQTLSPLNSARIVAMGEIHLSCGRYQAAEEKFRRAMKIDPELESAKGGLARCLIERGRIQEGRDLLRDMKDHSVIVSELNMRGVLLTAAGRHREAIALYDRALQVLMCPSKEYALHYNMALAYLRLGERMAAMRAVERSLKARPKFEKALALRSRMRLGKAEANAASGPAVVFSERQLALLTGRLRATGSGDVILGAKECEPENRPEPVAAKHAHAATSSAADEVLVLEPAVVIYDESATGPVRIQGGRGAN